MHGLWTMVRDGGWGALFALFLGVLGLLIALGAVVALMASRRAGYYVGVAALLVASLTAGVGLLGMSIGWHKVQAAAAGGLVSGVTQERLLEEGYREAQDSAKVGFGAALLPLLLGAIAVLAGAGARRKDAPPPQAWRPLGAPPPPPAGGNGGRWAFGSIAILLALITSGGALAATTTDPPKGKYDFAPDDTDAWKLAEARENADKDPDAGCDQLDDVLARFWLASDRDEWPRHFARDPATLIPDWKTTATTCARRIWENVKKDGTWTRPPATGATWVAVTPRDWDRALLLQSPLLVDEALHAEILAAPTPLVKRQLGDGGITPDLRDVLGVLAGDAGAPPPSAKTVTGATSVSGRLPPEVIRRIVQRHMGAIRTCYSDGLRKNPDLSGKVNVSFVIGRDGDVTSAKSTDYTLPDAAVRACIVKVFRTMTFPQPEGGIVTVHYPIVLEST